MKTEICVEGWGALASHQAGRLFSEALREPQNSQSSFASFNAASAAKKGKSNGA
jgi:hypothetical protein